MFNKRLLSLVPEVRGLVTASVVLQWIALLANIALMIALGLFVQAVVEGVATSTQLVTLAVGALAAVVVRVVCLTFAQRKGLAAASVAKQAVRRRVYNKLVRLGPSYAEHVSTSEAVQVSVEGTEQLESYFGSYLPQLFYSVLAPLTLFVCLAPLNLPAAAALLACVPLIPVSIAAVQTIAKRAMRGYWGSYTDLGAAFLENLQGLVTLKIYQADAARHEAMNDEAESFRRATMRLLRMQLNSVTVMDLFAYGGAAAGILVALTQFASGQVPFFAAFAVVFLAAEFFIPLRTLGSFFHTAMNGMAAAEKMFAILDAPESAQGTRALDPMHASLACEKLSYSYDGERWVLADVEFEAPAGSFTGIVGESGSGKSTLAGVLAGRLSGFEGGVTLGGVPLAEASPEAVARMVTVVSYQSYLFKGTVRENLRLANTQASDEELWEALRRCRAAGFVRAAGGLDAQVASEGANFSGGQRQRLALARALLHDTPVYLFDEATSNVDAESERAILETIHEVARTKTVIVISHRLAAVAHADRIYVMEDGRVAEAGLHDELVAADGAYARLWNQQVTLERFAAAADQAADESLSDEEESSFQPAPRRAAPTAVQRRSHISVMVALTRLMRPLTPWLCWRWCWACWGLLRLSFLRCLVR